MLVSRTAVSKWENGTCYPSIDSLKYMSLIFNISLDKLLSSEEILEIAKTENQSNISKYNSLLFCLLDILIPNTTIKLSLLISFCFPLLLFSITGFNHENFLNVLV